MIESIKKIVRQDHYSEPTQNSVGLEEKCNGSQMCVKLTNLPTECMRIKIPANGRAHSRIIAQKPGLNQSCDYLMLIDREKHTDAYFIEMKKTFKCDENGISKKAADQILCTIPLLNYLTSMAKVHYGKRKKIRRKFIIISEKSAEKLDKQTIKFWEPKPFPYKTEKFKVIVSTSEIPFGRL